MSVEDGQGGKEEKTKVAWLPLATSCGHRPVAGRHMPPSVSQPCPALPLCLDVRLKAEVPKVSFDGVTRRSRSDWPLFSWLCVCI